MLWRHLSAAVLKRTGVRRAHADRKSIPVVYRRLPRLIRPTG